MWLVTHATGTIGAEVARAAADRGHRLRLLVADPARVPAQARAHELVATDFTSQPDLAGALAGITHLVLISPLDARMADWQAAAARAAREGGVKHVAQVTGLGADPSSPVRRLRWLGEAEARVGATGLKRWVLRPAVSMQALLKHNPGLCCGGRLEAPFRRARMPLVDARDVAEATVRVVESDETPRTLDLTGTEALDYFEIARECSRAYGHRTEYLDICSPKARGMLEARGLSPRLVEALIEFWDYAAAGAVPAGVTGDLERILGRPPRSLGEFLHDAKASVRAASSSQPAQRTQV